MRTTGFYRKPENIGAEVPIEQMLRGASTENNRGIRLGGFVQRAAATAPPAETA